MVDTTILLQFLVNVCFGVSILLIHFRNNKILGDHESKLKALRLRGVDRDNLIRDMGKIYSQLQQELTSIKKGQ